MKQIGPNTPLFETETRALSTHGPEVSILKCNMPIRLEIATRIFSGICSDADIAWTKAKTDSALDFAFGMADEMIMRHNQLSLEGK